MLSGQFWRLRGRGPETAATAVIDCRALPGSLATEHEFTFPDPVSRRKFGRYWRIVRPFSGLHPAGRAASREASRGGGVKLATFGEGRVGEVRGRHDRGSSTSARCGSISSGTVPRATGRGACARGCPPARADHPEEVLPHRRQLPRARGGVEAASAGRTRSRRGSSSSRTSTRSSAPTSRSSTPST